MARRNTNSSPEKSDARHRSSDESRPSETGDCLSKQSDATAGRKSPTDTGPLDGLGGELDWRRIVSRELLSDGAPSTPDCTVYVDWYALATDALAGQPARLYSGVADAEHAESLAGWLGDASLAKPHAMPQEIRELVQELRRVRAGRPRKDDIHRAAALAWQVHEARQLYESYLRQYQLAKHADKDRRALEIDLVRGPQVAIVDTKRRLMSVTGTRGCRLSPSKLALEAAGKVLGRTEDGIRKLIFRAEGKRH